MSRKLRIIRDIVLPAILIVPLLFLLTGCFYMPWFEHRIDSGPNVRALVGDEKSDRPVRPCHITKAQVISLLGNAPWVSADGQALGYVAHTSKGSWVWPLCFWVEHADGKAYVVRLEFDEKNVLRRYTWADAGHSYGAGSSFNYEHALHEDDAAVLQLNIDGPILRRDWNSTTQPVNPFN